MTSTPPVLVHAAPQPFALQLSACALVIIDMQRDFLEPGGFGAALGNDVSQLRRTIVPNQRLLAVWRELRLPVKALECEPILVPEGPIGPILAFRTRRRDGSLGALPEPTGRGGSICR